MLSVAFKPYLAVCLRAGYSRGEFLGDLGAGLAVGSSLLRRLAVVGQRADPTIGRIGNEIVTASGMGLPVYPHARPTSDAKSDSAVDLGMSFGSFRFRLMVSKYVTDDSQEQVFSFYRKPLSRYGDVLECEHGEPLGALKMTRSGLTCSDPHDQKSHLHANESSRRELRSGTPALYRTVALGSASPTGGASAKPWAQRPRTRTDANTPG